MPLPLSTNMSFVKGQSTNNAARIDCVEFMTFCTRHRWREVRDFFPFDPSPIRLPTFKIDNSWLEKYKSDTLGMGDPEETEDTARNLRLLANHTPKPIKT